MRISCRNLIIFTIIYLFSLTVNTFGNISSEFINNIADRASNILSSKETKDLKIQKLIKIGEESADIDGIGLYMLGKHRKLKMKNTQ